MNTLEDRLREALSERAQQSPISADAWERTVARTRRRPRMPGWSRFMIPVVAAAAVVAVVWGASALTGSGGTLRGGSPAAAAASPSATSSASPSATSSASSSATSPITQPKPPGRNNKLIEEYPPVSAIVPLELTNEGQTNWTFVWFSKAQAAGGNLNLCEVTDGDGWNGRGGCDPVVVGPGDRIQLTTVDGTLKLGIVTTKATSVTTVLGDGMHTPGDLVSGRGFPYKVWAVLAPDQSGATISFTGAGGQKLGQIPVPKSTPTPSRPASGGIVVLHYPAHTLGATAGEVEAYLLPGADAGITGTVVGFWDSSGSAGLDSQPVSQSSTVDNFSDALLPGIHATTAAFYGYTHANVSRVVLRMSDGKTFGANTFAGWSGSGVRLYGFTVPASAMPRDPSDYELYGYDAAGHMVYQGGP
jgi:hypothetical protein